MRKFQILNHQTTKLVLRLKYNNFKKNNDFFLQLRVVCLSDTHSLTPYIKFDIPYGDVLIHAGDFTKCGSLQEVIDFNEWIGKIFVENLFLN